MVRLNLGSGGHYLEGWTNCDLVLTRKIDRIEDVRKLRFPDASVDEIYAGHVLEHFPGCHAVNILKEWKRVLKWVDGKLTVVVPNVRKLALKYSSDDINLGELSWGVLGCDDENADELDQHRCLYDVKKLTGFMRDAGYKKIEIVNLSKCEMVQSDADWQLGMEGYK